jgi:hypothetical protein
MAIATGMALAAGLGAAGSIYSASQNSKAAKRGAQAVTDASDQNIAESRRQFDINRQDMQPFIQSGYQRQAAQDQLLGMGNGVTDPQMVGSDPLARFRQSGFYQIDDDPRIRAGTNAAFSAKGMGLDGSAQVAMGRALQSNLYGRMVDYNNTLAGGAAQGLGAAQNLGAMGMNMAQNNAANRNNAANAMASSYQQQAQANNQGVGGALGALQWYGGKRGWF